MSNSAPSGDPTQDDDPASAPTTIKVRRPEQPLSRDLPKFWYNNEPFATHFLDALSSTFPFGEAFFVRSVLHYRERVEDPRILADIRAFAAQEGQHSRVHADHVQLLLDQGYTGLESINDNGEAVTRWMNKKVPMASLVTTAALEHLTALLARQVLRDPERFTAKMHPEMARLWRWHALEEAEHKSVAFDVMRVVQPKHRQIVISQILNTLGLSLEVMIRIIYMLWKDDLLFSRRGWRGGYGFLFGTRGLLRGAGADYLAWFRRDFHPEAIDDRPLIAEREPMVDRELAEVL